MNFYFILCILFRFLFTYITKNIQNNKIISLITFTISISFFYLFLFDLRLNAPEANGITWWNIVRPIHGSLFLLFTIYYFKKYKFAFNFLLLDTILGIIFFMSHHQIHY